MQTTRHSKAQGKAAKIKAQTTLQNVAYKNFYREEIYKKKWVKCKIDTLITLQIQTTPPSVPPFMTANCLSKASPTPRSPSYRPTQADAPEVSATAASC